MSHAFMHSEQKLEEREGEKRGGEWDRYSDGGASASVSWGGGGGI